MRSQLGTAGINNLPQNKSSQPDATEAAYHAATAAIFCASTANARLSTTGEPRDCFSHSIFGIKAAIYATSIVEDTFKGPTTPASFKEVRADARALERGVDLSRLPLWDTGKPQWFTSRWNITQSRWAEDQSGSWSFWLRWYQAAIDGTPLSPQLLRDIALLPNADWDAGPGRVAELIARIEKDYAAGSYVGEGYFEPGYVDERAAHVAAAADVNKQLARLPTATRQEIQITRQAIIANREALPPTFIDILGLIELEVHRLQGRNHFRDQEERDDVLRQIAILLTLQSAVSRMQQLIPSVGEVTEVTAESVESLLRLYQRKVSEWPRDNADEMVDSTLRLGLGWATFGLLTLTGASTAVAIGCGGVFMGKKIVDVAKAAIESFRPSKE